MVVMDVRAEYVPDQVMDKVLALLTPANELALRVALHTGLRIGDVLALRSPVSRQFWVTEAKTGKRRRVNLTQDLVDRCNRMSGHGWVFPGRVDPARKHRTRQAVWRDVIRASKALRIPAHVSTHTARKVFAAHVLDRVRGDTSKVRRALNHGDDVTTMIYIMAETLYRSKYREEGGRIVPK